MLETKTFLQVLQNSGAALYILGLCSIISLAIILERLRYFGLAEKNKLPSFMAGLRLAIEESVFAGQNYCKNLKSPFARVALSGLMIPARYEQKAVNAMDRQVTSETVELERYLTILGTIGSTAVYIGLFGTVMGIIHAFQSISAMSGGGLGLVIEGIAEALISTAAGIIVAVPAVISYNLLTRRISRITVQMDLCASETADLLKK
jgi:biopolymer transport protein ExbB